jgi:GT2 family glycosyltransferase
LNPDAVVRPGAIGHLVQFLESHPEAGIAGSSFEDADGSEWPMSFRFPGLLSELNAGLQFGLVTRLLKRWETTRRMTQIAQPTDWICGASMMIRTAVFEVIGGFDEHYFLYYEETDFCYRARQAGFATWYVPDSRVMHIRGQSTQVTNVSHVPKRLPGYWFDSRRRYFYVTFGFSRALAIDAIAVIAYSLGSLKQWVLRRTQDRVPHLVSDLMTHSIWRPKNQNIPPLLCTANFRPR